MKKIIIIIFSSLLLSCVCEKQHNSDKNRMGIMGATPEEISGILPLIKNVKSQEIGNRKFYTGNINNTPVVLVFSKVGKVASGSAATTLINVFNVSRIVFLGAAGAVSRELNIGDIIISDKLYQYDMDDRPKYKKYEIPVDNVTFFNSDKNLIAELKKASEQFIEKSLTTTIDKKTLEAFHIRKPKVYIGTIASGDQFISAKKIKNNLLKKYPETKAVEMEGAAIAQVCFEYKIPFAAARIISDKAKHRADINYEKFIKHVIVAYANGIITNLMAEEEDKN